MIRLPGLGVVGAAALLFLYVPIAVVVALSFNASSMVTLWGGFSLHWWGEAARDAPMRAALGNSLLAALAATAIATPLATAAALAFPPQGRAQGATRAIVALPLLVPEIVLAVALLLGFVLAGIPLGLPAIAAAHAVVALPFAYLPIRTRLDALDPALGEAARDLYASPWRSFRRVTFPLIAPGVASGAMLAFVVSLGDFTIAFFLSGPGSTTLPVYVFGLVRTGLTPAVNAVSTTLLLLSVGLVAASRLLSNR